MNRDLLRPVDVEEVEMFWRDGVVCLRGVVDRAWLEWLADPIEALLVDNRTLDMSSRAEQLQSQDVSVTEDRTGNAAGDGRFKVHSGSDLAAIRRFETESMLPEVAGRILRSDFVQLFIDQILVKEPGTPTRTAFHVDEPYFNLSGHKVCTVWVPLDAVTPESGAMAYVRGSHRWAQDFLPNKFVSQATLSPEGTANRVRLPDIEGHPEDFDLVQFEVEPGDVIVHHFRTAHGSGGNITRDRRRRAVAVRYCGDDVRWEPNGVGPTKGVGIAMLENELLTGEPLSADTETFPKCWTSPTVTV